jgi:hypothetical protein
LVFFPHYCSLLSSIDNTSSSFHSCAPLFKDSIALTI